MAVIGALALIAIVLFLAGVAIYCRGEENDSKAGDGTGGAGWGG